MKRNKTSKLIEAYEKIPVKSGVKRVGALHGVQISENLSKKEILGAYYILTLLVCNTKDMHENALKKRRSFWDRLKFWK